MALHFRTSASTILLNLGKGMHKVNVSWFQKFNKKNISKIFL